MAKHLIHGIVLMVLAAASSCHSLANDSPPEPTPEPEENGPSALVVAEEGHTLVTESGIQLEIPPGALAEDTDVTIRELTLEDPDGGRYFGVQFEPDGLTLAKPAVLRLPLPDGWEDSSATRYDFVGTDPAASVQMHEPPKLEDGNAVMPVTHFSGVVCARNCHAGTIRQILRALEERGCSRADVLEAVRAAFPEVDIPEDSCGARSPQAVQALLRTFFDDHISYDAGDEVSPAMLDQAVAWADEGRLVVLAFSGERWRGRDADGFYPDYRHTAVLEQRGGRWMIRNSLATFMRFLVNALGGNTAWYPFESLNEFRETKQGVVAELQTCGAPGCLADPTQNEWGYDLYARLDDRPPPPWRSVRFYVENVEKVAELDCYDGPPLDFPRRYQGNATIEETLAVTFADMSTVMCEGEGEWSIRLNSDGTVVGTALTDKWPNYYRGAEGPQCYTGSKTKEFVGSHDPVDESITVAWPIAGARPELIGSYNAEELRLSGTVSHTYDLEWQDFEPDTVTATYAVDVVLSREP